VPRTYSLTPRAPLPLQEVMSPAFAIATIIAIIFAAYIADRIYKLFIDILFEYDLVKHKLYICQQIIDARINYH
jgi:hypothetical protein